MILLSPRVEEEAREIIEYLREVCRQNIEIVRRIETERTIVSIAGRSAEDANNSFKGMRSGFLAALHIDECTDRAINEAILLYVLRATYEPGVVISIFEQMRPDVEAASFNPLSEMANTKLGLSATSNRIAPKSPVEEPEDK